MEHIHCQIIYEKEETQIKLVNVEVENIHFP
jgi:hypothetical protein